MLWDIRLDGSTGWLVGPFNMPARPRFTGPFVFARLDSGDSDCGGGIDGEGCVVAGTVLGMSRKPGGFVSYAPDTPLTRGGSCAGGGGSAYQLFLCGGSGSNTRMGCGGGTEDWG